MIQDIFKTSIYQTSINIDKIKLLDYVDAFRNENKISVNKSNDGGYQSPNLDINLPIFKDLIENINDHLYKFGKELNFSTVLNFSSLWFNINGYKDSNKMHSHSGIISGVYYSKVPKNSGDLVFYSPNYFLSLNDWGQINFKSFNERNSLTWKFTPIENVLYFFPSYLFHSVEQNKSIEERISFSFNFSKVINE